MTSRGDRGSGCSRPGWHGLWREVLLDEVAVSATIKPSSRQPTNWIIIIPKKFSHYCKSSRTHNRFLNLGILQRDWESPGNLTWKTSGIWLPNFQRTGEIDSWRAQQNLVHAVTQEKGTVTPQETEPDLLFQILKDDAVKVLHSICQQIWKTQQWPQDWKRSVFIPIPKKGSVKEGSNYRTIALILHAS